MSLNYAKLRKYGLENIPYILIIEIDYTYLCPFYMHVTIENALL